MRNKTSIKTATATATTIILSNDNHATKTLKSVLKDIDNTSNFIETKTITRKNEAYKVESEKISNMFNLLNELNNDVVKYAYGKRIKNISVRGLNEHLKEQEHEQQKEQLITA